MAAWSRNFAKSRHFSEIFLEKSPQFLYGFHEPCCARFYFDNIGDSKFEPMPHDIAYFMFRWMALDYSRSFDFPWGRNHPGVTLGGSPHPQRDLYSWADFLGF